MSANESTADGASCGIYELGASFGFRGLLYLIIQHPRLEKVVARRRVWGTGLRIEGELTLWGVGVRVWGVPAVARVSPPPDTALCFEAFGD